MHLVNIMQRRLAFLPRIVVAVVLIFALLSGIVPFSSASAGHLCAMECCSGLAPHAAGSCHMDMSSHGKTAPTPKPKPESDKHCEITEGDNGAINGIAAGVMGMKDGTHSHLDLDAVTIDASDHDTTNSQSVGLHTHSHSVRLNTHPHNDSTQPASIATQSFSKPCPPQCGTGALSSSIRPSRDTAALAYNARPRPPTLVLKRHDLNSKFSIASAYCKQVRPRGPPSFS